MKVEQTFTVISQDDEILDHCYCYNKQAHNQNTSSDDLFWAYKLITVAHKVTMYERK